MQIDITKIITGRVDNLSLDDEVIIPKDILTDPRINNFENLKINGDIYLNDNNDLILNAKLSGKMILKDDVTLEPVLHEFMTDFEEILPKNQNILDITDILWQNILVEIPSKVRKTSGDINLSGDGWRVISEDKYNEEHKNANNPFTNLDELLKTKEDK